MIGYKDIGISGYLIIAGAERRKWPENSGSLSGTGAGKKLPGVN
jgi:hypothetical protein